MISVRRGQRHRVESERRADSCRCQRRQNGKENDGIPDNLCFHITHDFTKHFKITSLCFAIVIIHHKPFHELSGKKPFSAA